VHRELFLLIVLPYQERLLKLDLRLNRHCCCIWLKEGAPQSITCACDSKISPSPARYGTIARAALENPAKFVASCRSDGFVVGIDHC
jgi:hypothetical protein